MLGFGAWIEYGVDENMGARGCQLHLGLYTEFVRIAPPYIIAFTYFNHSVWYKYNYLSP